MKNWFKKIFIALILILSFNIGTSQNSIVVTSSQQNQWLLSNQSCYGCGSFYLIITTKGVPKDGYYYYDIYFWSNSFYTNGYAANTYIKNINVYAPGLKYNAPVLTYGYIVVPPKSYTFNGFFYLGYVYSVNSEQTIEVDWSNANAW